MQHSATDTEHSWDTGLADGTEVDGENLALADYRDVKHPSEAGASFTQALHSSATIVNGQPVYLGNPNGIVIKPKDGPSVYHMGDTEIYSDMALIAEIYAPKIGIVPIGDRFTMSGKTAALAVKRYFDFDAVIPCHYGTFDLLAPDASTFGAAMQGHKTKVLVPRIGEALLL